MLVLIFTLSFECTNFNYLYHPGTYYCYAEFRRLEKQPATHPVDASDLLTWLKSLLNRPNVWLCLCIISGGLAVIVTAILLMVRHRITIAIAMVVEGSK